MSSSKKQPRILFFDLETSPDPKEIYRRIPSIGAWPGRTFKADIQSIICFGYKWLHEPKAKILNAWDYKNWKKNRNDDTALLKDALTLLSQADEVVTHNGKQFDMKVLQTRLMLHGMGAVPKIPHVDTKVVAKSKLSLYSNSLDELSKFLKVSNKMEIKNKWDLWVRIAYKEETARDLKLMSDYCKQDVISLEHCYKKLRPHHNGGVNFALYAKHGAVCPACGSEDLISNGFRKTKTGDKLRLRCNDCGTSSTIDSKGVAGRL